MSELVVVGFSKPYDADALLTALKELDEKSPVDVDDSAVVVKDAMGEVQVDQAYDVLEQLPASGALYFGFLGAVLGWILSGASCWGAVFGLQAGVVGGWILGIISGQFAQVGIPRDLIGDVGASIGPETSALCVLTRGSLTAHDVLEQFSAFSGKVLHTSLPPEEAVKVRQALAAS